MSKWESRSWHWDERKKTQASREGRTGLRELILHCGLLQQLRCILVLVAEESKAVELLICLLDELCGTRSRGAHARPRLSAQVCNRSNFSLVLRSRVLLHVTASSCKRQCRQRRVGFLACAFTSTPCFKGRKFPLREQERLGSRSKQERRVLFRAVATEVCCGPIALLLCCARQVLGATGCACCLELGAQTGEAHQVLIRAGQRLGCNSGQPLAAAVRNRKGVAAGKAGRARGPWVRAVGPAVGAPAAQRSCRHPSAPHAAHSGPRRVLRAAA
jgi:hypothetical protein